MLPFLKNNIKNQTGVTVKTRAPDESAEPKEETADLESIIQEGIEAYKAGDMKRLAKAVKEAHDCLHEYMDSDSESNDFHSQNEKAAKE